MLTSYMFKDFEVMPVLTNLAERSKARPYAVVNGMLKTWVGRTSLSNITVIQSFGS